MTLERRHQIERLHQLAFELPPDRRPAFLSSECAGDAELLHEVKQRLAQEASALPVPDTPATQIAAQPMAPGSLIGPYLLEAPLGAGGMGEVFRALDTRLRRTVAIKFLHGEAASDVRQRRRLLQEARAASALNHPNIVVLYDVSSHEDAAFIVMEHVAGQTLKDLIPPTGMVLDDVAHFGAQVAAALDAAHTAGIVHRDIKPQNIMVTSGRHVKVVDFGLARMTSTPDRNDETATQVTLPGMIMGTVSYMSPEQVRGEELDGRSDIFSLGCVLYEAATGTRPFGGSGSLAVMHEIATAAPPPPSGLRAGLPDSFDRLIAACLEKDPTRRPATAALVAERLKTLSVPERVHVRSNGSQSVAVIPFRFRTGAAEDRFLSVALAEAVINRLGANGHLLIRPISSVMRYAGTDVDCSQVARDLNVDLVIEGSIQKLGPRLRVMVQALQMSDSRTLHSSLHDGDMGDLFTLQDRLADAVSGTFAVRTGTSAEPALPPTQNALAYELYMRAAELVVRIDKFDLSSAIGMLSRAVELDPQFADAWGRLAQAYANMGMHLDADPRWFEQADLAIARTLEIDPVQCEALCARAQVLWSPSRGFQNRPALRAINAALKVNPHRPLLRQFRSVILLHLGYYGQAERDANETLLANPEYAMAIVCQATTALYRGDYEASTAFYDRVLTLDPGHVLGNIIAPLPLLYSGRIAEAREQVRKARQMVPSEAQLTAIDAMIAVLEGDFRKAGELADDVCSTARKSVTHTHHSWHCSAGVYALIGEPEKALAQLRRCGELGLPNYRLFRSDPWLKPLRELPEFTALMSDLVRQHDQYCVEIDAAGRTQTEKEPSSGGTR